MKHWFKDTHFRSLLKNSSYLAASKIVAGVAGIATLAFADPAAVSAERLAVGHELQEGPRHPVRGVLQPLPVGVLADGDEDQSEVPAVVGEQASGDRRRPAEFSSGSKPRGNRRVNRSG